MNVSSDSDGFLEALATGLGRLEEGLVNVAAWSKLVRRHDCLGPRNGVCRCDEQWCVPPLRLVHVNAIDVAKAVRTMWPLVAAHPEDLNLTATTVSELNARLRGSAGLSDELVFVDQGRGTPWPGVDGRNSNWTLMAEWFTQVLDEEWDQEVGVDVLCELTWDGHVPALGLTTGWLLASGLRLRRGLEAFAPDPVNAERFLDALDGARPGIWDSESVRALWPDRC